MVKLLAHAGSKWDVKQLQVWKLTAYFLTSLECASPNTMPLQEQQASGLAHLLVAARHKSSTSSLAGCSVAWHIADEVQLLDICVATQQRRQGIGRLLLQGVLAAGQAAGCRQAVLEVNSSNIAAISLYKQHGFEVVGQRQLYYSNGDDALLMQHVMLAPS